MVYFFGPPCISHWVAGDFHPPTSQGVLRSNRRHRQFCVFREIRCESAIHSVGHWLHPYCGVKTFAVMCASRSHSWSRVASKTKNRVFFTQKSVTWVWHSEKAFFRWRRKIVHWSGAERGSIKFHAVASATRSSPSSRAISFVDEWITECGQVVAFLSLIYTQIWRCWRRICERYYNPPTTSPHSVNCAGPRRQELTSR